ncbi:MAG: lytic transglycosylase [Flavobacteriales bacterium]|jgi:membrane-bound lytic murein transglycosylase D|nr:lytic transglycosylase [Flavobacteriales bacterium]
MLFKQHYRLYIIILIIFLGDSALSQNERSVPAFSEDHFLLYDTMFIDFNLPAIKMQAKENFDEDVVRLRLDSLNKLTPINLTYNKTVGQFIKFYLQQRPEQVSKLLALSDYYFPVFEEYLDKNTMPLELKYLPIIESALNPNAKSPAGAVGLWQFMYYTAKEYGLRINSYLDERKDIYKSTDAACRYLIKAYKVFNDWELSLASYNCGRGNVTKALRRSGGKLNYWEVRPFLPRETRNYIPAFISIVYVMNYATHHGIYPDTSYNFNRYKTDSVYLKKPVKISHLAKVLDIDEKTLEKLNPVYRNKLVPYKNGEKFHVILPDYKWGVFLNNEDSIYSVLAEMEELENLEYPIFSDIEKVKHVVKRGDYLGRIARIYKCKVSDIMMWNDLKSTKIREGQKLYIYQTIK